MPTAPQVPKILTGQTALNSIDKIGYIQQKVRVSLTIALFLLGQLLDEVAMRCVDPSQCQVCIHEGQRISHGNKVILNHDDPDHCKIW